MLQNGIGSKKLEQIDHYKIIEKLGQGGMGIVYKCYDMKIKRTVAIKCMLSSHTQAALRRFMREINSISKLNHPNIVKTFSIGFLEKSPYIVMEHIDGVSLSSYLQTTSLEIREKMEILQKIASAVSYAHKNKIIHRDLKPDNILMRTNGEPVLMDFGLAKTIDIGDKSLTKSGNIIGTPQYMAPEQARGIRKTIDFQTDIYGLGATLYYILTHKPPFTGNNLVETAKAVLTLKPKRPKSIHMDIPNEVEYICLKALEKKKTRRYKSMDIFSKDIHNYLNGFRTKAEFFYLKQKIIQTLIALIFIITPIITGIYLLSQKKKNNYDTLNTMRTLSQQVSKNPSQKAYILYIKKLEDLKRYHKTLDIIEEAISWCKSNNKSKKTFLEKKADILFTTQKYAQSEKIYRKIIEKNTTSNLEEKWIHALFKLKKYDKILEISQKSKNERTYKRLFYTGASKLLQHYKQRNSNTFIKDITQEKFANNEELKQALNKLKEAFKHSKLYNIVPYICYCYSINGNIKKFRHYKKYIKDEEILSQKEKALLYESQAIIYYWLKDYNKACKSILKCSKIFPWESTYYKFLTQLEGKKKNNTMDSVIHYAIQTLNISPYDLDLFGDILESMFQKKCLSRYTQIKSLLMYYYSRINEEVKPNILYEEFKELAIEYSKMEYFQNESPLGKMKNKKIYSFIKRAINTDSLYIFDIVKNILADQRNNPRIFSILKRIRKGKTEKQKKKLRNLKKFIKKKIKEDKRNQLKQSLAQFFITKDNSVYTKILQSPQESVTQLKNALHDPEEEILFRFWCAQMLMELKLLKSYTIIKQGTQSSNTMIRLFSFAALENLGFEVILKEDTFILKKLQKLPEKAIIILLQYLGDKLPAQVCHFFTNHANEKIRICAVKSIVSQGNITFIEHLVREFNNKNSTIRAYVYWAFLQARNFEKMQKEITKEEYFKKIAHKLLKEKNKGIKLLLIVSIKKLLYGKVSSTLKPLLKKLEKYLIKMLKKEQDNALKIQILIVLIRLDHYEIPSQILKNPNSSFALKSIMLLGFSRFTYDPVLNEKIQQQLWSKMFFKKENRIFIATALLEISLFDDYNMNDYRKKILILSPLTKGLKHKNDYIRHAAAYTSARVWDKKQQIFIALKKAFSREKEKVIRDTMGSSLLYLNQFYGYRDKEWSYNIDEVPKGYTSKIAEIYWQIQYRAKNLYIDMRNIRMGTEEGQDKEEMLKQDALLSLLFKNANNDMDNYNYIYTHLKRFCRILKTSKHFQLRILSRDALSLFKKLKDDPIKVKKSPIFRRVAVAFFIFSKMQNVKTAVALNPYKSKYFWDIGYKLEQLGIYEKAYPFYQKAIRVNPKRIAYKIALARLFCKMGKYNTPIIKEILKYPQKAYGIFEIKGKIYQQLGKSELTEKMYTQSYIQDPHSPALLLKKCNAVITNNKLSEGEKELKKFFPLMENKQSIIGEHLGHGIQKEKIQKFLPNVKGKKNLKSKKNKAMKKEIELKIGYLRAIYYFIKARIALKRNKIKKGHTTADPKPQI